MLGASTAAVIIAGVSEFTGLTQGEISNSQACLSQGRFVP
jgi:hypothetical protein